MGLVLPRQAVAVVHCPRAAAVGVMVSQAVTSLPLLLAAKTMQFMVHGGRVGPCAGLRVEAKTVCCGCCFCLRPGDSRGVGGIPKAGGGGCFVLTGR